MTAEVAANPDTAAAVAAAAAAAAVAAAGTRAVAAGVMPPSHPFHGRHPCSKSTARPCLRSSCGF